MAVCVKWQLALTVVVHVNWEKALTMAVWVNWGLLHNISCSWTCLNLHVHHAYCHHLHACWCALMTELCAYRSNEVPPNKVLSKRSRVSHDLAYSTWMCSKISLAWQYITYVGLIFGQQCSVQMPTQDLFYLLAWQCVTYVSFGVTGSPHWAQSLHGLINCILQSILPYGQKGKW